MALEMVGAFPRGRDDRSAFTGGPCTLAAWTHRTLDFTPDGTQPFTAGAFTVALDGYVANAPALRRDLEEEGKVVFRGHGDAELIAQGAKTWGLNRLLQKLEGAFTFVLWDSDNAALHLVRDRLGARPLYVTLHDEIIAFASDYRAFRTLPGFTPVLDTQAMRAVLAHGHIPAPYSPWKGVFAVPPGHRLMIGAQDMALNPTEAWWSPASAIEESALRAHGDTMRRDRLFAALSAEALRLDVSYALLDDLSPASSQLRSNLDRASGKPYTSFPVSLPDGIALQMAYDSLCQLPEPMTDPMAPSWYLSCKNAAKESPVCVVATGLEIPVPEDARHRRLRRALSYIRFLHPVLPGRYRALTRSAESLYMESTRLWTLDAPQPDVIEPRGDISPDHRLAFWAFADGFRHGFMPAMDRIGHAAGVELRMPWADARLLDCGLPCPTGAGNPDMATWLRGPLRPRVSDQMNDANIQRLGLEDPAPYLNAWQDFLNGNNAHTRPLWTLAVLLGWAAHNEG